MSTEQRIQALDHCKELTYKMMREYLVSVHKEDHPGKGKQQILRNIKDILEKDVQKGFGILSDLERLAAHALSNVRTSRGLHKTKKSDTAKEAYDMALEAIRRCESLEALVHNKSLTLKKSIAKSPIKSTGNTFPGRSTGITSAVNSSQLSDDLVLTSLLDYMQEQGLQVDDKDVNYPFLISELIKHLNSDVMCEADEAYRASVDAHQLLKDELASRGLRTTGDYSSLVKLLLKDIKEDD